MATRTLSSKATTKKPRKTKKATKSTVRVPKAGKTVTGGY